MNRVIQLVASFLIALPAFFAMAQEPRGVADRLLEDLQSEEKADTKSSENMPRTWHTVSEEMKRIAEQLPRPASSEDTLAAQSKLIEELAKLLAQSENQPSSAAGSQKSPGDKNQGSNGARKSSADKGEDSQGAKGDGPGTKAGEAGKTAGGDRGKLNGNSDSLVRRAWGQLPGRVRERLQTGAPEKFHEKYRAETENYFRRLSEMEQRP